MSEAEILSALSELGYELPAPPQALAAYAPCVRAGDLLFVAGQIPMLDGIVLHPGRLGDGVAVEAAQEAARRAALQALSLLRAELGSLDRIRRVVQVSVFVAATPEFTQQPQVANGASEMLVQVLGDAGRHARAAVGVASLPLGASVEVAMIVEAP